MTPKQRVGRKKKKNSLQCPVCGVIGHKSWKEAVSHQGSAEPPSPPPNRERVKIPKIPKKMLDCGRKNELI